MNPENQLKLLSWHWRWHQRYHFPQSLWHSDCSINHQSWTNSNTLLRCGCGQSPRLVCWQLGPWSSNNAFVGGRPAGHRSQNGRALILPRRWGLRTLDKSLWEPALGTMAPGHLLHFLAKTWPNSTWPAPLDMAQSHLTCSPPASHHGCQDAGVSCQHSWDKQIPSQGSQPYRLSHSTEKRVKTQTKEQPWACSHINET